MDESSRVRMMHTAEAHDRIHPAQTNVGKDCYSRAFYLGGFLDEERPLQPSEIRRFLSQCSRTNEPTIGSFVHLFNGEKEHIALITGVNPITVSDRAGLGGETREGIPLTDVMFEYGGLDIAVNFFKP